MKEFFDALLRKSPRLNFFQFCQLLERQGTLGIGTLDTAAHEPVRFCSSPKLGFPGTELVSVESGTVRPIVRTSFLGLYGVNAAMASHFIDDIALRRSGHEAVMAFLDMFNHRIATLLYRAWRKYRYVATWQIGASDEISRHLLCLAGFGIGDKAQSAGLSESRVLGLLGLLTQRTRTAEGLQGVIAIAVPGAGVLVDMWHPVWMALDAPARIGPAKHSSAKLGRDHVLGRRMTDKSATVRVTLMPTNVGQVNDLLPDAPLHREVMSLLRVYIGHKVDVVLRMDIPTSLAPLLRLGRTAGAVNGRLAWTTLLKPSGDRAITIPLGKYEAVPSFTN
jgi:type VI secretion system protein ImpH